MNDILPDRGGSSDEADEDSHTSMIPASNVTDEIDDHQIEGSGM
jgi:hypothetical protein